MGAECRACVRAVTGTESAEDAGDAALDLDNAGCGMCLLHAVAAPCVPCLRGATRTVCTACSGCGASATARLQRDRQCGGTHHPGNLPGLRLRSLWSVRTGRGAATDYT